MLIYCFDWLVYWNLRLSNRVQVTRQVKLPMSVWVQVRFYTREHIRVIFGANSIAYLGHVISSNGVTIDPRKCSHDLAATTISQGIERISRTRRLL
jgi:hypothetical protein